MGTSAGVDFTEVIPQINRTIIIYFHIEYLHYSDIRCRFYLNDPLNLQGINNGCSIIHL